ncbi:hypothetical protein DAPPUDRAFT_328521 [Daphnia pulex]|uniref:Endonuclease/exonuclease/phosphatase domain-containing protein n=1 Tax=Daphnia pulex TaxID=6669 RepID=E9HDY2_DAPPU|nr:hypothetical protein DAPPUDRAFT_328521 [Daphnia pulex]|eukprot:EFX70053.1 hypothetical protein DAPPUDRAFT_328521 [Daphnia pulex]
MQKSLQSSQSAVGQHVLELCKQVKQDEERYNVSPDKLDANDIKKAKAVSVLAFLAELPLATINSLSKTDLISRLSLEYEVSRLSDDLDIQADQIKFLEEKISPNEIVAIFVKDSDLDSLKKELNFWHLANQHISNFPGCVELTTTTCPLCLSYVYLRPSIYNFSTTITPILEAIAAPFTIIDTDANAKFQLWNSMLSDKRGSEFEPMLAYFILNVVNRSKTELDFSPSGTCFVDLTLVGDKVRVHRWLYLATPSISDHPYIFFEIDHVHFAKSQMKPNCWLAPNLSRVNRDLFSRKLFYALSNLPTPRGSGLS